jgi:hypothetical protein
MFEEISKENVMNYFQNGKFQELLNYYCNVKGNDIIVNYYYFKYLANQETYDIFTNLMIGYIDSVLQNYNKFNVHISINKLSVMEIHKHIGYIRIMTDLLKSRYQDKMGKCCIYNASNIFSQIYEIIVPFIDPDTQKKIELVSKK